MHFGRQEWQQLQARTAPEADLAPPGAQRPLATLYRRLADHVPDEDSCEEAAAWLDGELAGIDTDAADLPATPDMLLDWMQSSAQSVHARYAAYLEERRAGGARRFFRNRAHALFVLRCIAPTKLVDGAWLYGLVAHWRNPRLADLVRTYVEELGEGQADKNHVVLYRRLLAAHALDPLDGLDDALYRQGAIQLALGWNAQRFLPEIIGFNLGYEQLPLHLLITAYELNELGIDPYYFTLHVTVDNPGTGHARRACQAALDLLPRIGDNGAFWRRMRAGAQLANTGPGTSAVIDGFAIDREVQRILAAKAASGSGAHSDYCKLAGRPVNEWLADPAQIPAFLSALQDAGWIVRNAPPEQSRFWRLLHGDRAEMFGVFSTYELQVIHDWIRGDASADGAAFDDEATGRRRPTFRAQLRNGLVGALASEDDDPLDPDLQAIEARPDGDEGAREALLVEAMAPCSHWTPAGLAATREFWARLTH